MATIYVVSLIIRQWDRVDAPSTTPIWALSITGLVPVSCFTFPELAKLYINDLHIKEFKSCIYR